MKAAVFRGPGINNWDLSFFKNFPIKEHVTFQFRWELYNAFNHASFQGVNNNASFAAPGSTAQLNGQFGQITSTNGLPRVMQGNWGGGFRSPRERILAVATARRAKAQRQTRNVRHLSPLSRSEAAA